MYSINDDIKQNKQFISKENILAYVSEEEIFELVFGFRPKPFQYVTSPFRKDEKANCWFQEYSSGKLKFVDFASQSEINGKRMINIDCFDAVMLHFGFKSFVEVTNFIYQKLVIPNKHRKQIVRQDAVIRKDESRITAIIRSFKLRDRQFWYDRYLITKEDLVSEGAFPIDKYELTYKIGKKRLVERHLKNAYAFTDFEDGRLKLYFPFGKIRFMGSCTKNDIGGIKKLPNHGKFLIITSSFKDYLVVKKAGFNTTVWFMGEGMYPDVEVLFPLVSRFEKVFIFYDNDKAGIKCAESLMNEVNLLFPGKASYFHLPELLLKNHKVKDPSDFVHKYNYPLLTDFINKQIQVCIN